MKKVSVIITVFVLLLTGLTIFNATAASAAININGYLDDWGVTPGAYGSSQWTPFNGIQYTVEDQNTYFLNPGYGGQAFDAEAIYYQRQAGKTYIAIVTGHPSGGASGEKPGDVYLNFGAGKVYGIETTGSNAGELYLNPSWNKSTLWGTPGIITTMMNGTGTEIGMTDFIYAHTYYGSGDSNDHWVMEMAIPDWYFGSNWTGIGAIHWTETCGNDYIDLAVHTPEPATMSLLGVGLFGLIAFRRKKKI